MDLLALFVVSLLALPWLILMRSDEPPVQISSFFFHQPDRMANSRDKGQSLSAGLRDRLKDLSLIKRKVTRTARGALALMSATLQIHIITDINMRSYFE